MLLTVTDARPTGAGDERFAGDDGAYFRWHAATWTHLAEEYSATADHLETTFGAHGDASRALEAMGVPAPTGLLRDLRAVAVRARLTAQLNATMALAYDDMVAAGGPDNPEALAHYRVAAEWCASLQPRGPLTDPDC